MGSPELKITSVTCMKMGLASEEICQRPSDGMSWQWRKIANLPWRTRISASCFSMAAGQAKILPAHQSFSEWPLI